MKLLFLIGLMLMAISGFTQDPGDSLAVVDTGARPIQNTIRAVRVQGLKPKVFGLPDSTLPNTRRDSIRVAGGKFWEIDSFFYTGHPYFRFTNPIRFTVTKRQWQGKEPIFYTVIGLLIFFALIKNSFYRYIQDLLKIFFRTTVRQRQIKEQLLQSPLPSLLLNIFFLLSSGMFLALLLQHLSLALHYNFWTLFFYCVLSLMAVYGVKFITLKFLGWALQVSEASNAYIFVVFTTNKMIGMALLPALVMLALAYGIVSQVAITIGISIIVGLFAYRYFLSYITIHRQIKISFFHFLIYLCAFEIAPLLLINKLLFTFLG